MAGPRPRRRRPRNSDGAADGRGRSSPAAGRYDPSPGCSTGPRVPMHHHRNAWAPASAASMGQARAGTQAEVGQPHLGRAADQQAGAKGDHRRASRLPGHDRAAGGAPPLVAAGDDEFGDALDSDGGHQQSVPDRRRPCPSRVRLPAQQDEFAGEPGPHRQQYTRVPGGGRFSARVSRSTWSTDDEDRLPTSAR